MIRYGMQSAMKAGATLALVTLSAVGCSSKSSPAASSAEAAPTGICAEVGGAWDQASSTCGLIGTNAKHITVKVSAKYPTDLVDDPTAEPILKSFLREFFTKFGHPDDSLVQDGSANLTYQTYEHSPSTKSVVFTHFWNLGGVHPNDEIDTFTFDLAQKKQLALADLFCPGVDPLQALPPYVKQYVQPQVDPNWVQPSGQGTDYSSGYKEWLLDRDNLVILMPAGRAGPVHAAAFKARIPLSTLKPILRDGGCSA